MENEDAERLIADIMAEVVSKNYCVYPDKMTIGCPEDGSGCGICRKDFCDRIRRGELPLAN